MKVTPIVTIICMTIIGMSETTVLRDRRPPASRPLYDRCQYRPFAGLLSCQLLDQNPFSAVAVYPNMFGCAFSAAPVKSGQTMVPSDALQVDAARFEGRTDVVIVMDHADREEASVQTTEETSIQAGFASETDNRQTLAEYYSHMHHGLFAHNRDRRQTDETDSVLVQSPHTTQTVPSCALWRRIDSPIYAYTDEAGTEQVELYFTSGGYQWFHLSSCHGGPVPIGNCAGSCVQTRLQHRAAVVRPDLTVEWEWVWLDAGCTLHH